VKEEKRGGGILICCLSFFPLPLSESRKIARLVRRRVKKREEKKKGRKGKELAERILSLFTTLRQRKPSHFGKQPRSQNKHGEKGKKEKNVDPARSWSREKKREGEGRGQR